MARKFLQLSKINERVRSLLPTNRRSSSPGEYWHCDTIPLGKCWDGLHEALVLVDDFPQKIYVYAMKTKRQACVAEALTKHFNKVQLPQSGQRHLNFYTHRLILRSDQGSEFINTTVQSFCNKYGITQEFSCPGDLGKWQNGYVNAGSKTCAPQ
jgi:transposase InsO family protein